MTQQVSTRAETAGQRPSPSGPQPGTWWAPPSARRVGDVPALSAPVNTVSLAKETRPRPWKMGEFPDTRFHGGREGAAAPGGRDVPREAPAAPSGSTGLGLRPCSSSRRAMPPPDGVRAGAPTSWGPCVPGAAALCSRGVRGPGSAFTPSQHFLLTLHPLWLEEASLPSLDRWAPSWFPGTSFSQSIATCPRVVAGPARDTHGHQEAGR